MLSALKRLTGSSDNNNGATSSSSGPTNEIKPGLQTLSSSLQKKFARGVQYNMKIIIKGDRSVGKTCLFHRLQGHKFLEEYIPSEAIAVTCIQWGYKATDDIVKVEVWDVVDKGKKRKPTTGLKLCTSDENNEEPALDAEFIDVYKGTNGVILVMDMTKQWTYEYVQRELDKIPNHIPVLVLANHCDMAHHRAVTTDTVLFYIEALSRDAPVRYTEGSMRNGFGLRYIHKFLNIPFLQLQKETLLAQIDRNERETMLVLQELDLFQEGEEACYDTFLDKLTNKRRQQAENSGLVGVPQPINTTPLPPKVDSTVTKKSPEKRKELDTSIVSVEEFVPDVGGWDNSFLDEPVANINSSSAQISPDKLESDSDNEITGNPLVAAFQDDIDPSDTVSQILASVQLKQSPPSSIGSCEDVKVDIASGWSKQNNEADDAWSRRRSPEGREENSDSPTSQKTKKKNIKTMTEEEDKKKKSKKKKGKKKVRNELEEFLSGTSESQPVEEAYEAI